MSIRPRILGLSNPERNALGAAVLSLLASWSADATQRTSTVDIGGGKTYRIDIQSDEDAHFIAIKLKQVNA